MSNYFQKLPDFEYVSRLPDSKISDYITVKNLFKKNELRPDIFNDATVFTEYQIKGDDRPDNVAFEIYNDSTLDWLVLLSNNIINIQTEWPLLQNDFDRFLLDKYGTYEELNAVHHYETQEVKNSQEKVIVPKGLEVNETFSITYYDSGLGTEQIATGITDAITNKEYEERINDNKRNIFLIKPRFVGLIIEEMENVMPYPKGSTQYVSPTVVKGENIRIYD